jgi:hypothetical protein
VSTKKAPKFNKPKDSCLLKRFIDKKLLFIINEINFESKNIVTISKRPRKIPNKIILKIYFLFLPVKIYMSVIYLFASSNKFILIPI